MEKAKPLKIWMGGIYLESYLENEASIPNFIQTSQAFRCFFIEYNNIDWAWKLFISFPDKYDLGNVFHTKEMKEDVSKDENRYFNDALGDNQLHYESTFTLIPKKFNNEKLSFLYRQKYGIQWSAFSGGMSPISLDSVPLEWMDLFEARSTSLIKKESKNKNFNDYYDKDKHNEETIAYSFISENHEKMISVVMQSIDKMDHNYLANAKKIKNINSEEIVIWHIANQFHQFVLRNDQEATKGIGNNQLLHVHSIMDPLTFCLNDKDFDKLGDDFNLFIRNLRAFNNQVLGYYLIDTMEIDKITADFLNIYAWKIEFYYSFGITCKNYFKNMKEPRLGTQKSQINSLNVDQIIDDLWTNVLEFQLRHQCSDTNEFGVFYKRWELIINDYYDNHSSNLNFNFIDYIKSGIKIPKVPNVYFDRI